MSVVLVTPQHYLQSQNTLRLIWEIEKCKFIMQGSMVDSFQFSSAIAKYPFLKGRLGTRLYLHSVSKFDIVSLFHKILSLTHSVTDKATRTLLGNSSGRMQ